MWMPLVAGIFNVLIGCLILGMLLMFGFGTAVVEPVRAGYFVFSSSLLFLIMPGIAIGSLAIISGIFAIRKEKWGLALAGSIGASLVPMPLGIAAIILLVLSRGQFR